MFCLGTNTSAAPPKKLQISVIILFQSTKVLLVLLCLSSNAFAGLLPGGGAGGSGYQYNRPGGSGFGGFSGDVNAGGGYRRPSSLYGTPGGGGDTGGFARPSTAYGAPGQFGSGGGGYQDGGYQGGSGGGGGGYGRDNGRVSYMDSKRYFSKSNR